MAKSYRIVLFVLMFTLSLNLSAQEKPLVVTTTSMIADLLSELSGDEVIIKSLVPIGGDPHLYEPTPGDAQLLNKADLILKNGFTLEGWLDELIENSGTKGEVVVATKNVSPIKSAVYENAVDPHAWMDVQRVAHGYMVNIKDALIKIKPDAQEVFDFNFGVYQKQLLELNQYITDQIQTIPQEKRILITSHDAFQYYGKAYGIQLESIIGISTEEEAKSSDILRINKMIKEKKIPAVFVESTINPKMLEQIAKDNKVVIGGKLYADSLGDEDSGAHSYYDMMKQNTNQIVAALKKDYATAQTEAEASKASSSSSNVFLYGALAFLLVGGFLFVAKNLKK